jgi:DNA-binding GntR family transcriptional regulator
VVASLQTIATETGLSKSAVQIALRLLRRRGLLDAAVAATVTNPARRVLRPWVR